MTTLSKDYVVRMAAKAHAKGYHCGPPVEGSQFFTPTQLQHFATLARADIVEANKALVAENERLKALSVTNIMVDVVPGDGSGLEVYAKSVDEVVNLLSELGEKAEDLESVRAQLIATWYALAAADADNERLCEALRLFRDNVLFRIGSASPYRKIAHEYYEYIWPMITQPRDDSALRRLLAEDKAGVYEECAKGCETRAVPYIDSDDEWDDAFAFSAKGCATAIRALAEKAKEEKC